MVQNVTAAADGTECDSSCGCAAATDERNGDRKTAERAVDCVAMQDIMSRSARYEVTEDLSLLCPLASMPTK